MPNVLVIDDEKSNAQLLQVALERVGYQVTCASNGADGLRLVEELTPDIIITDLRLGGGSYDGWEMIGQIRNRLKLSHIPILVTSVEVLPDDRLRAYEAGCNFYIPKPYSIKELLATLEEYLN
jgi:CheY-like chemotaxis protein